MSNKHKKSRSAQGQDFNHSHSLGQNFLVDPIVCPRIAENYNDKNYGVLEIGPGQGALTLPLSKAAGKVCAVEIDTRLSDTLNKIQAENDNIEVIFGDVMKLDLHEILARHLSGFEKLAVCANLPYYITSPIIMMLLEERLPLESITVMVQKEAGERLCAPIPSRDCGAVTYAVRYYCDCEILFHVGREAFFPVPNVDSCVIKLTLRKNPPAKIGNPDLFFKIVKAGFAQRRKTLLNSLCSNLQIEKAVLQQLFNAAEIPLSARMEELSFLQTAKLCELIEDK